MKSQNHLGKIFSEANRNSEVLEKDFPRQTEIRSGWKKIFQGKPKSGMVGKRFSEAN